MLRCTIDLLPHGDEASARTIGVVEIANIGGTAAVGNYAVVLKKTPPFTGALREAWRKGLVAAGQEDDDFVTAGSRATTAPNAASTTCCTAH